MSAPTKKPRAPRGKKNTVAEPQDPGFREEPHDLDASDVEADARRMRDEADDAEHAAKVDEYEALAARLGEAGETVPTFEEWLAGADVPTKAESEGILAEAEAILAAKDPASEPIDHTGVTKAEVVAAVTPRDLKDAPALAEGEVLPVDLIEELKDAGHRSPKRVYGTGLEQARQAVAWGYDGITYPTAMAPDATEAEWAQATAEYADRKKVPALPEPAAAKAAPAKKAPAKKSPGLTGALAGVAEVLEPKAAAEATPTKPGDSAGVAPVLEAVSRVVAKETDEVVLRGITAAELSLAQVTLGRFGYRAFDSWGDLLVPFDYAEGEELPEAPTLTGKQHTQLVDAIEAHKTWLGKAKKADADRVAAVERLGTKVAGYLAA